MLVPVLTALALAAGPPPAYVTTPRGTYRLAQSSYCWRTSCVDFVPPRCDDGRTPRVRVRVGELLRFRLGFRPKAASLVYSANGPLRPPAPLDPTRLRWRVRYDGPFVLFTRTKSGFSANYGVCFRLIR